LNSHFAAFNSNAIHALCALSEVLPHCVVISLQFFFIFDFFSHTFHIRKRYDTWNNTNTIHIKEEENEKNEEEPG
jgi:hypothetical protein